MPTSASLTAEKVSSEAVMPLRTELRAVCSSEPGRELREARRLPWASPGAGPKIACMRPFSIWRTGPSRAGPPVRATTRSVMASRVRGLGRGRRSEKAVPLPAGAPSAGPKSASHMSRSIPSAAAAWPGAQRWPMASAICRSSAFVGRRAPRPPGRVATIGTGGGPSKSDAAISASMHRTCSAWTSFIRRVCAILDAMAAISSLVGQRTPAPICCLICCARASRERPKRSIANSLRIGVSSSWSCISMSQPKATPSRTLVAAEPVPEMAVRPVRTRPVSSWISSALGFGIETTLGTAAASLEAPAFEASSASLEKWALKPHTDKDCRPGPFTRSMSPGGPLICTMMLPGRKEKVICDNSCSEKPRARRPSTRPWRKAPRSVLSKSASKWSSKASMLSL
mmetsp:Transcript_46872/g.100253  ORF Transcript_46872/g.100253 Transcript_46872/m.100253 type:complete len:398 (+) Transcript_46872:157-1350(+)